MNRKATIAGVFCVIVFVAMAQLSLAVAQVTVSSSSFSAGGSIPKEFTCDGANVNPPLRFSGLPAKAKSFVLIVDDPDAPGGLFTHWLVWNIDPSVSRIPAKSVPAGGIQGTNDFGHAAYSGPCPPSGTHRYRFQIFALDCKLSLHPGAKRPELDKAMTGHELAHGTLTATYSR